MQLDRSDELYDTKEWLLTQLGIAAKPILWQKLDLAAAAAAAARVLCLRHVEVQQLEGIGDLQQPSNPRNEAAALASLVTNESVVCGASTERQQQLQHLTAAYPQQQQQQQQGPAEAEAEGATTASDQPVCSDTESPQQQRQPQELQQQQLLPYAADSPEQQLLSWVLSQGASSQVIPAEFPIHRRSSSSSNNSDKCHAAEQANLSQQQQQQQNSPAAAAAAAAAAAGAHAQSTIRGCAATSDLPAGSNVISLPAKLLITYKTAAESDFGRVLTKIGLDPDTLAVVWTMVERWDEEATARPFWQALPEQFNTGLSVPEPLVDLLKGTPIYAEMASARQHIRQQFQDLQQAFKVLLTAYPTHLQESWFNLNSYMWAVELWYAYAIQVKFPDGTIQAALAPFVSLLNHSPWPHIVHFSTVDPKTRQLNLTTFRPVQQHDQVFLSYGPLPNAHLLLFYGFTVQGNPFEEVQLTVDLPQQQQQQQRQGSDQQQQGSAEAAAADDLAMRSQLLQQLGLGLQYTVTMQQPVPLRLLAALRVLHCSTAELHALQAEVQGALQQEPSAGLAVQNLNLEQHGDVQPAAAAAGNSSRGKPSSKKNKSSGSKSGNGSGGSKGASSSSSSNGGKSSSSSSSSELEQRWAAAAVCRQVLGQPLSDATEAKVKQVLRDLLARVKAPYGTCLARIARRRQLQAMLLQKQKEKQQQEASLEGRVSSGVLDSSSGSSAMEDGFLACVEVYARDLIALCDASGSICGL